MKADQVLIDHHEVLRGLLKQLDATTDDQGPKRRKLLDSLVSELGVHVKIEDELFYPDVRDVTPLEHHAGEEERVMFPQSHALGEAALESLMVVGADHLATARPRSWARIRVEGNVVPGPSRPLRMASRRALARRMRKWPSAPARRD